MPVIREATLRLRDPAQNGAQPRVLHVRVYDQTNLCGGGWFELRGEDGEGNVRFAFRDPRKLLVVEEFESTLAELAEEYRVEHEGPAAHG